VLKNAGGRWRAKTPERKGSLIFGIEGYLDPVMLASGKRWQAL